MNEFLVDCEWHDDGNGNGYVFWGDSTCSVTCGNGTEVANRIKMTEAKNGGKECDGNTTVTRPCVNTPCPGK